MCLLSEVIMDSTNLVTESVGGWVSSQKLNYTFALPLYSIGPEFSINPLVLSVSLQIFSASCPQLHQDWHWKDCKFLSLPSHSILQLGTTDYFQPGAQQACGFSSAHSLLFLFYLCFIVVFKIPNNRVYPKYKMITTYASL